MESFQNGLHGFGQIVAWMRWDPGLTRRRPELGLIWWVTRSKGATFVGVESVDFPDFERSDGWDMVLNESLKQQVT